MARSQKRDVLFFFLLPLLLVVFTLCPEIDGKEESNDDVQDYIGYNEQSSSLVVVEEEVLDGSDDDNRKIMNNKNIMNNTCAGQSSCKTCYGHSSFCHWCEFDNECHAIGSVDGCTFGSSCKEDNGSDDDDGNDDNDDDDDDTDSNSCSAQTSCSSCTNTRMCHWCAHDHACHAIGSVYGCVSGVDCFSNDRCKRSEPEPLEQWEFTQMSLMQIIVSLIAAFVVFCCTSTCFFFAMSMKGVVDDLTKMRTRMTTTTTTRTTLPSSSSPTLTIPADLDRDETTDAEVATASTSVSEEVPNDDQNHQKQQPQQHQQQQLSQQQEVTDNYLLIPAEEGEGEEEAQPLLNNYNDSNSNQQEHAQQNLDECCQDAKSKHIQRMYRCCVLVYFLTILAIISGTVAIIYWFPKIPEYNVCSDEVAWRKIIDSMASLNGFDANFEILMSIENSNHLDIVADMGRGNIKHNDVSIGTYDLPPNTSAPAMSIIDALVVADITPEKWEALSLTKEYYSGRLVLHLDGQFNIRVPALWNYSFEVNIQDIQVRFNDLSDRHLCSCQQWEGNKTVSTWFT